MSSTTSRPRSLALVLLLLAGTARAQFGQTAVADDASPASRVAAAAPELTQAGRVQVRYRIEVPEPGSSTVQVTCEFTGELGSRPRLGLIRHATPAVRPTLEAYRIEASTRVRIGDRDVAARWVRDVQDPVTTELGLDVLEVAAAPGAGEALVVTYDLDLADAAPADANPPEAKDRVAVTDGYALLRGDVLLFAPGAITEGSATTLELPAGWDRKGEPAAAIPTEGIGWSGMGAVHWVLLAHSPDGAAASEDALSGIVVRVAAVGEGRDEALAMVRERVRDHVAIFGTEDLGYLPRDSADRPLLTVIAVEDGSDGKGQGGQYIAHAGLALFFYRTGDPWLRDGMGRTISHELFHVWNDSALSGGGCDKWWGEGFTDAVAVLQNSRLLYPGGASRLRALQGQMDFAWKNIMDERGVLDRGTVLAGRDPRDSYSRALEYDIPLLYLLRVASLMGPGSTDRWFRRVQADHGFRKEGAAPPTYAELKAAALAEAGGARAEVEAFLADRFEGPVHLTRTEVDEWQSDPRLAALAGGPTP